MSLSKYSVEELLAEIQERFTELSGCRCGPDRVVHVAKMDGFQDRTGCTNCNLWDGPLKLA